MPKKNPHVEHEFQTGIIEAVWLDSYMSWAEEHGLTWTSGHIPQHVQTFRDIPQAVPQSAKKLAAKFASVLVKSNRANLTQIWERASQAEGEEVNAQSLGFYLTMQAAGHGISWTDNHATFNVTLPYIEWWAYGKKGKVQVEGSVDESGRIARRMT